MAAEYMHVGIPVLNKKPNMVYNDWGKFWVNESVDAYDFKIEYLKFEGPNISWTIPAPRFALHLSFGTTPSSSFTKTKTDSLCTLKA